MMPMAMSTGKGGGDVNVDVQCTDVCNDVCTPVPSKVCNEVPYQTQVRGQRLQKDAVKHVWWNMQCALARAVA